MRLALINGERKLAESGLRGICPLCSGPVIAKCGEVNIKHWAHESLEECYGGPETEWHMKWKELFPVDCTEIVVKNHRADVIYENCVYEFQSTPMSAEEMNERGRFWESEGYRFFWIVNMEGSFENFVFKHFDAHSTFRWKWPKQRLQGVTHPIFLDFSYGANMLLIKKIYWGTKVGGYGLPTNVAKLFPLLTPLV